MKKQFASYKRLPLVLAVAATLYGPIAFAQDAQQTPPAKAEESKDEEKKDGEVKQLETVKVTGSLISRLGFDSVSPVQVITADTSATTGQLDTAAILQTSNVAAGSTQFSNQFSGFVVEGGNGTQTVSLRGLGSNRTLVLLDGRRPGPAGTRGQVGAFDLNVVPSSIVQRAEILKDGGGSIYGSDAIGGVINIITRKRVDRPLLSVEGQVPTEGGGERFSVSGAYGWDFDKGGLVAAFEVFDQQPLKVGDRDFFECSQDLVRNAAGLYIDRVDRSIIGNTPLGGCNLLYANTVISGATRYVPSPNGVTIGPLPGYRPRTNANFNPVTGAPAFYEDVLNFEFMKDQHIFSSQERASLFASADFSFDNFGWSAQFLYTKRETESRRFRQFFPVMNYSALGLSAFSQPIMPFPSNQDIDVDYYYISTGFNGGFGSESSWTWRFDTSFSRSDGDYTVLSIDANRTGDRNVDLDGGPSPVNYLDPQYLSGQNMQGLVNAVGAWHTGNTIYDQFVVNATATGNLFELPAGSASAAFGTEFRRVKIDDNPSDLERQGRLWGQSAATGTEGKDYIFEVFGEFEAPLLSGIPGIEQLVVNASARAFKYDTVEDADSVWKVGMGWQIIPSLRFRGTKSTSYRAPGLYELFLGDQTGFVGQFGSDPCIDWGNSNNPNIRANCAAAGVPANYTGAGSSITVVSRGGQGRLRPETARAKTAGLVFAPSWANFSASVDYFEIDVRDQVSQLGAATILNGCYALPNYPNEYCTLLTRNGATGANPFNVTRVLNEYINVNKQKTRGYDLNVRWDGEFGFGKLEVESQFTYTLEAFEQLFAPRTVSGFNDNDFNGTISRPKLVGNVRTALNKGSWTYTWGMNYVDETENFFFTAPATYFGNANPVYDRVAEDALYHSFSVRYAADKWDVLVGANNLFDKDPPTISAGVGSTRYGNIPAFATQYDWYGRSIFARFNYRF